MKKVCALTVLIVALICTVFGCANSDKSVTPTTDNEGLSIVDNVVVEVQKDVSVCRIPEGVTAIKDGAFKAVSQNGSLSQVHIPSTIKKLSWGAFGDIPKGTPIYFNGSLAEFISITDFDWDNINLFTANFKSSVTAVIILASLFILLAAESVVIHYIKKIEKTEGKQ